MSTILSGLDREAGPADTSSSSSNASAVDLSAIEQQKENIQPLASGRSAKALHTLFTADRKTLQDDLKEGHDRFKREIEQAESEGADDPLDVYHRYVRWTLASYPSGPSHDSHLIPLLERATRRFVHEEQYKSDIRLLKLWILYAKYIDCPKDIFRFLEGLQVGVKLASFYEEWAMLEEQSNNFPSADAIYNLGIARRAQPAERLKKRREAFQARMMLPRPLSLADSVPSSSSETRSIRPTLGKSTGSSSTFRGTALSASAARAALPNNGAAGFAVFQDGTDENGKLQAGSAQDGWDDFGTNSSRRRENERAATAWKGETLPMQAASLSASQGPRLEVFRDEDAEVPAAIRPLHSDQDGLGFKALRAPGDAELLRKDPFRLYSEPIQLGEAPEPGSIPPPSSKVKPSASASSSKPSNVRTKSTSSSATVYSSVTGRADASSSSSAKKTEKVASPLHDIYPDGLNGPEYSFEEIEASKRGLRSRRTTALAKHLEDLEEWEIETRERGTSWQLDSRGKVILRDQETGEALFDYLRKQDEAEQEEKLRAARKRKESAEADRVKAKRAQEEEEKARRQAEDAELAAKKAKAKARIQAEAKERLEAEERARQAEEEQARELQMRLEAEEKEREQQRLAEEREAEARRREAQRLAEENAEQQRRIEAQRKLEEEARQLQEEEHRLAEAPPEQARREEEKARLAQMEAEEEERLRQEDEEIIRGYSMDNRPPSPTINTKAALAEVNAMFSKTMRFDDDTRQGSGSETEQSEDDDEQDDDGFEIATPMPASQAETDGSFWSQAQSQSQQPFAWQQSVPSQGSSSSGLDSESGETTEESESEDDYARRNAGQYPQGLGTGLGQPHMPISRSSSTSSTSSSSSAAPDFRSAGFGKAQECLGRPASQDENELGGRIPFKPNRAPLAAKGLSVSSASAPKPAFQVFSEEPQSSSTVQQAASSFAVFSEHQDNDVLQNTSEMNENQPSAIPATPGYAMGRRINGNNRFASMMDVMTPITERTCEFGMTTATLTGSHLGDVKLTPALIESDAEDDFEVAAVEDLASSRGSNWEEGRRQLQSLDEDKEDEEVSERVDQSSQEISEASTVIPARDDSARSTTPTEAPTSVPPCNPLDSEIVQSILQNPERPLSSLSGFFDCTANTANKLPSLQKRAQSRRKSNSSRASSANDEVPWELTLANDVFSVREKLGEGGYGAVFRVAELVEDMETEEGDEGTSQLALKVESPTNVWEFFILDRLHTRLSSRTLQSIVKAHRLYAYKDESHLLLDYCDQGTLLDAVNHAQEAGVAPSGTSAKGFEEVVAIFFTVELMRILEDFHAAGFLHGDFKVDNCLLRLEEVPGGARAWSSSYKRDGSGGWSSKGLKIIDFGRTTDLSVFPPKQRFSTNWKTDNHDCAEMREGTPWTYQPDYYGLACIAHVLIFGKYLETVETRDDVTGRRKHVMKESLKRYHQIPLWTKLFDLLLNPCEVRQDGSLPLTQELGDIRREMEDWLEANSEKSGKSLKGLLKKLEIQALSRQR